MALNIDFGLFKRDKTEVIQTPKKQEVMTLPGIIFKPNRPDTDAHEVRTAHGRIMAQANDLNFYAPVILPNGAEIVSCVVRGASDTTTWKLFRTTLEGGTVSQSIFISTLNTPEYSYQSNGKGVVDNEKYLYYLEVEDVDYSYTIESVTIVYNI